MYHTTGLSQESITDLCALIHNASMYEGRAWPPILGLFKSVVVTLSYLRRNRVQEELAETYGISQSTVSRAIAVVTPLVSQALEDYVPTTEDLQDQQHYVVDGSLLPCWSWSAHPELYSGKHQTTGMNVQVACTLEGALSWVSKPVEGARHDVRALRESGALEGVNPGSWIGDKGYIGEGMVTPFKKPQGGELLEWQEEFNTQVNKIRYVVEQAIGNMKTWRILHTDYRRPLQTFEETISAVIALHFYRLA